MTIIEFLSKSLSTDSSLIKKYILTCPYRYKIYTIPKRSGAGRRTIAQPAKELKYIQKLVCEKFLKSLPIHNACTAYMKKINIKDNALVHVKNRYLLKMDFKDFFPSIRPPDLINHVESHLDWDMCKQDKLALKKIFFYLPERKGSHKLSIGAPTSPFISNTIMYEFDTLISKVSRDKTISYSRYADDIAFSTNTKNILFDLPDCVSECLSNCKYPNISLHPDKTVFLSRKGNMHLTGLVLTNDGKVSIGRKKKRFIKSLIYKQLKNELVEEEILFLSGYLSFCWSVEPDFIHRLENKYGKEIIHKLQRNYRKT